MIKNLTLGLFSMLIFGQAAYGQTGTLKGKVFFDDGSPAQFADVLILRSDSSQVTGIVVAENGAYELKCSHGDYILQAQFVGYDTHHQAVTVSGDHAMDDITLVGSSQSIASVEVRGRYITREADRFVVQVADNPVALGKTAAEMLEVSPGVSILNEKISINGNSGVKVMIDDRIQVMSDSELLAYLRSLSAEDIQKIEILPVAGADMDADSSSGIIKITLKKQRRDGIDGSVGLNSNLHSDFYSISPRLNINYRINKLSLYSNLNYQKGEYINDITQITNYPDQRKISSFQYNKTYSTSIRERFGVIYDFNKNHSLGAEFFISTNPDKGRDNNSSKRLTDTELIDNDGKAIMREFFDRYSVSVNYIMKPDTLGSTFKFIGNYSNRLSKDRSVYNDDYFVYTLPDLINMTDQYNELSWHNVRAQYGVLALSGDYDKIFRNKMVLKFGAKYTRNDMDNLTKYHDWENGEKVLDADRSLKSTYIENIGAVYASFRHKWKKLSYQIGLRMEYTNAQPKIRDIAGIASEVRAKQNYFSFFPNANLMIPLNEEKGHSIILEYARRIHRPGFWQITPWERKIGTYTYAIGNPNLDPSYINNFSLSTVFAHKYNVSFSARRTTDKVQQVLDVDGDNLTYNFVNMDDSWSYYISLNAPMNPFKWWTINLNATYIHAREKLPMGRGLQVSNGGVGNMTMSFSLPKDFYIEPSGYYQSKMTFGNLSMDGRGDMNLVVKKLFFNKKLTTTFGVHNVFENTPKFKSWDKGVDTKMVNKQTWAIRYYRLSVTYNFRYGINVNKKTVESTGDESRLN